MFRLSCQLYWHRVFIVFCYCPFNPEGSVVMFLFSFLTLTICVLDLTLNIGFVSNWSWLLYEENWLGENWCQNQWEVSTRGIIALLLHKAKYFCRSALGNSHLITKMQNFNAVSWFRNKYCAGSVFISFFH